MNANELAALKTWFSGYVSSFVLPTPEDRRNIEVKEEHTREVCRNALGISGGLRLDEGATRLVEAAALLHDVGRFRQYRDYKTFDDEVSVNHAALGAKALIEENALDGLAKSERDLIVRVVAMHNVFLLPKGLDRFTELLVKIIRDADKLDIWRVFIDYCGRDESGRASAVVLGLEDTPGYSPDVLACLRHGTMSRKADLRNLNDFKLLQLSWLYDLNFTSSRRMLSERGHIDAIAATLPSDAEIAEAVDFARAHLEKGLREAADDREETELYA
jgi:hypothetical protein